MTTDRAIGLLGIVIGIPAFLALFFESAHRREAILSIVIIGLLIAYRVITVRQAGLPPLTVLEIAKQYVIEDAAGTLARFEAKRRMRANFSGVSEFWMRNIIQDGTIGDFQINGMAPAQVDTVCGTTHICDRFPRPLQKGEEITSTCTYTLRNSFTDPRHEGVIHSNTTKTKLVTLSVILPKPCINAEVIRTVGGQQPTPIGKPEITNNQRHLEVKIKKPQIGASYHLEWDW